jgi:hypothetical protein
MECQGSSLNLAGGIPQERRFETLPSICGVRLRLVGDLISTLMTAGRFGIILLVIQFLLEFPLLLSRLGGVLRCGVREVHFPQGYAEAVRTLRSSSANVSSSCSGE